MVNFKTQLSFSLLALSALSFGWSDSYDSKVESGGVKHGANIGASKNSASADFGFNFQVREATAVEAASYYSGLIVKESKLGLTKEAFIKEYKVPAKYPPMFFDFKAFLHTDSGLTEKNVLENLKVTNQVLGKCGIGVGKASLYQGTLKKDARSTVNIKAESGPSSGDGFVRGNGLHKIGMGSISSHYLKDVGKDVLGFTLTEASGVGVNMAILDWYIKNFGRKSIFAVAKTSLMARIKAWFGSNKRKNGNSRYNVLPERYESSSFRLNNQSNNSLGLENSLGRSNTPGSYHVFVARDDKKHDKSTTVHEILHALSIEHCGFENEPCSNKNVMNAGTDKNFAITDKQCAEARETLKKMNISRPNLI